MPIAGKKIFVHFAENASAKKSLLLPFYPDPQSSLYFREKKTRQRKSENVTKNVKGKSKKKASTQKIVLCFRRLLRIASSKPKSKNEWPPSCYDLRRLKLFSANKKMAKYQLAINTCLKRFMSEMFRCLRRSKHIRTFPTFWRSW